jgi:IS5 family transposase
LLTQTIEAGKRAGTVKGSDLKRVTVDTTAMEKIPYGECKHSPIGQGIAHPTDARLYETARRKLVGLAREAGIGLRQNYNRLGPRLAGQVGRYAHARQFKRMRKALRKLKGYTGRVLRDIERQLGKVPEGALRARLVEMIALVNRLLAQKPKDKKKLYSLHEPAVDCISKGKAHKRYEFGTKVSVATTNRGGFVVGMRALPGNPYDGHTLSEALEQVEILTDQKPEFAFVDRGYRGHGVENVKVFISGARRGVDLSRFGSGPMLSFYAALRSKAKGREYPKLCVWGLAHAVKTGHLLNRSGYKIANWFRAATHSLTHRPVFSNLRIAR